MLEETMAEMDTRQEKREKILEAALTAYARYGIHAATTRQIADIAGIGKSTIFEYFKTSDELMDAAFVHYIGQATANRTRLHELAALDPVAALSTYYDNMIELIIKEPDKLLLISQYVTAILASGIDFADVKRKYAEKLQQSADSLLEEFRFIAETGIGSGVFIPVGGAEPQDCALLLNAIAREMQSQAFVQEECEILNTCQRLKRMAFGMLGVKSK
jgi:AcrR family transcriptional regulator